MLSIEEFEIEVECEYKGRIYSVRDNGAVFRHQRLNAKPAPLDNVWTFGRKDLNSGYLMIAGESVHRIVTTAFWGVPKSSDMVVDHIDTNRCNNRPSNLRWVTRLENVLNNPITRAKIERVCGSIDAFIKNPSLLYGNEHLSSNFSWMRSVTPEEAKISYEKWLKWAKRPLLELKNNSNGPDERIYKPELTILDSSVSDRLVQNYGHNEPNKSKNWRVQMVRRTEYSDFPLAPLSTSEGEDVLQKYINSLECNKQFLVTDEYITIVKEVVHFKEENRIRVLSERLNAKRIKWYIFEIWADKNVIFHEIVGSYTKNQYNIVQATMSDLAIFHRQEWKYKK